MKDTFYIGIIGALVLLGLMAIFSNVSINAKYQKGDLNLDGKVDQVDFAILMRNYNGETKIQECKLTEVPQY